jgi:hypothetical protein
MRQTFFVLRLCSNSCTLAQMTPCYAMLRKHIEYCAQIYVSLRFLIVIVAIAEHRRKRKLPRVDRFWLIGQFPLVFNDQRSGVPEIHACTRSNTPDEAHDFEGIEQPEFDALV